jgi:hypothetical protein
MLIPVAGPALLAALPVAAAEGGCRPKRKDTRPISRLPNGKPDLSGVWDHPRVGDFTKGARGCDTAEHPHSDALTVVERLDRIDYRPGDELYEYSCDENNKEVMEGHVKDDFFTHQVICPQPE